MGKRWTGTALLTLTLLVFVVILLADSRNNSAAVRLFPLILGGFTLVLLATLLLSEWSERVKRLVDRVGLFELVDTEKIESFMAAYSGQGTDVNDASQRAAEVRERSRRVSRIMLWIVGYLVLILLTGFLAATPLFLLGFWILEAKERPKTATLVTIGVMLFIYGLFVLVLRMPIMQAPV